jgi:hypothetical protein
MMRRPLAQKLQGNISLSTEIRRERSKKIIGIPSEGVVLVVRDSVVNMLKHDINAAYPTDDELLTPAPEVFRPRRRQRSPAQLQALQRENDRRREAKLAKAIHDREALASRCGSEGSSS